MFTRSVWGCKAVLAALMLQAAAAFLVSTHSMSHASTHTHTHTHFAVKEKTRAQSGTRSMSMMPIGVPKVAYRVPGGRGAEWIDIYQRLYRERIIFLGQEIDDELANQIIGVMLYLDNEDPTQPIYMYINCPGGSVIAGLAIFDTMQHIRSEIVTINVGLAASMASYLLAAGTQGRRYALPHSRVMIHQPMGGAQGQAEDIKVEASQIMRIRDNLVKSYAMMTGQTQEQITKDLDRDNFMSAYEAAEYGLVDGVIESHPEKSRQLNIPPPSVTPDLWTTRR